MLLAILMAAAAPWVEMSGGPALLHPSGQQGMSSGPMLRVDLGMPVGDRLAGEVWLSGAMQSAPLRTPGDSAVVGAGVGGRLLVTGLGSEGKLGIWAHAGAGWGAPAAGTAVSGPTGFAGALLSFQPFLQRFQLGVELDALAFRQAFGLALLPSLRCTF
jgi:hypothetical protein